MAGDHPTRRCGGYHLLAQPASGRARSKPPRPSYFRPRGEHSEDDLEDVTIQKLRCFYQELASFCDLAAPSPAGARSAGAAVSGETQEKSKIENFAKLWTLSTEGGEEVDDEQLFSLVFLSELQTLSPGIRRNNVLVDGLFSCILEKVNEHIGTKPNHGKPDSAAIVKPSAQGSPSLLEQYWQSPSCESKSPMYLEVGKSFVYFVHNQFGRAGINSMMKQLAYTENKLLGDISLKISGKSLHDLEARWLSHLKYEYQPKCQISVLQFFFFLLKLSAKSSASACPVFLASLFLIADVGSFLYCAIAFGEISEIASVVTQANITSLSRLVQPASLLLGTVVVHCCASVVLSALMSCVAVRLCSTLRNRIINAIYSQRLEMHHHELISMFLQDVAKLEAGIGVALVNVIRGIAVSIASIIGIVVIAWKLGLALALAFVGMEIFVSLLKRKLGYYRVRQELATGRLSTVAREVVDGHLENRVFGLLDHWISQYQIVFKDGYRQVTFQSLFFSQVTSQLHFFIALLLLTCMILGGLAMVVFGDVTFKNILIAFILFAIAVGALRVSGNFLPMLEMARMALSRILAFCNLSCKCDLQSPPQRQPDIDSTAVAIDNVSFAYSPGSICWHLCKISLDIDHSQHVAIVGPSGSGKSTLLKVITGYYKPVEGSIFVCGHNMATTTVGSLPVSVVAQNSHFFRNMSILENLQLANRAATLDDIRWAAESSRIHEWISYLPHGYHTVFSSNFSTLITNEQRQRLGLARSLLKHPRLLILDDITQALDSTTGLSVISDILKAASNISVFAAVRNVEEAAMFDRIVVLSHGVVKECGSHRELMAARGRYFQMWKGQRSEYQEQPVVCETLPAVTGSGKINAEKYFSWEGQSQHLQATPPSISSGSCCKTPANPNGNADHSSVQPDALQGSEKDGPISTVPPVANTTAVSEANQPQVLNNQSGSALGKLSIQDDSPCVCKHSIHSQLQLVEVVYRPRATLLEPEGGEKSATAGPGCATIMSSTDTTLSACEVSLPAASPPTPRSASRDRSVVFGTLRQIATPLWQIATPLRQVATPLRQVVTPLCRRDASHDRRSTHAMHL